MPKAELVELKTPKKYILEGLYFPQKASQATAIYLHGLGGSVFSSTCLINPLVNQFEKAGLNFLAVNNRGHDTIANVKKVDRRRRKGRRSQKAGAAHEVFTDCVDDIQGMIKFVNQKGGQKIFLIGHSTGCQKAIYFLSKKGKQKQAAGVVLLSPMSDYAWTFRYQKEKLPTATKTARKLVDRNEASRLLPPTTWDGYYDAQRFLSLYTPDSEEEIFTYAQPDKQPLTFQKVKIPILAIFAEKDQYRDRPIKRIASWFEQNTTSNRFQSLIVPEADHGFTGHELKVANQVTHWLTKIGLP